MIMKEQASEFYFESFAEEEECVIFSHGRLEIVGNHTDHNKGEVLVAGCDMGITAGVGKNEEYISVASKGYRPFVVELDDLEVHREEEGTSASLVRGVLAKLKELGYKIGGFNMACVNDIFPGAGVSSSAAFESLVVKVISHLYNEDSIPEETMAVVGQYAENVYFGKPCGLLDQIGTSLGGVCYVDFHKETPIIERMSFPFAYRIFLVNSEGNHADLTPLYAEIPADMKSVARHLYGVDYLGELTREEYFRGMTRPCISVSERAKMRATHFFEENARVENARFAIKHHDEAAFMEAINSSGFSSSTFLANTQVPGKYAGSPQQTIDTLRPHLGNGGAIRIMGGGFAGSVICFIPEERGDEFLKTCLLLYRKEKVAEVRIVDGGPRVEE
ncbi:MAG: galactokinase [Bacilli bacterium]|nr:galactokinase [Bacilli bacterium]